MPKISEGTVVSVKTRENISSLCPFHQMPRHHRQAIKNTLGSRIRLGQSKAHRVRINLLHFDGFSANNQQIALRRMNVLVEVSLERKHYILGVEGRAIGEAQTVPQLHRELPAILGH